MTVLKVTVVKHPERSNWYKMTITSLCDDIGQTTMELLLRTESMRSIREGIDRALDGREPLDTEFLRKIGD